MALLSDVDGVRVYFVGDRPRSGTWRGGNDAGEGEEDAGAGGSQKNRWMSSPWAVGIRVCESVGTVNQSLVT